MYPYRPRRMGPPPNYAARRVVAAALATVAVLLVWLLFRAVTGDGDATASSTTTEAPSTTTPQLRAPDACAPSSADESEPTIFDSEADWYRTLLDTTYALPDLYEPPDLVPASAAGYSAEFQIREFVAEDLNRMRNAILQAGIPEVALLAAYRSIDSQTALFDRRVEEMGFEDAAAGTARPGHSEHHLGTTIDVRLIGATNVDESFGATSTGQWLAEHSWEYGFILSYPAGKEAVTCYKYEPWHFRYLGPQLAQRVFQSELTLREYLWHWEVTGTEPFVSPAQVPQPELPTTTVPPADG